MPGDYGNVNSYMWVPILAPLVGGLVGAFIYNFFIHNVLLARAPAAPPPGRVPEEVQARPPGYAGPESKE